MTLLCVLWASPFSAINLPATSNTCLACEAMVFPQGQVWQDIAGPGLLVHPPPSGLELARRNIEGERVIASTNRLILAATDWHTLQMAPQQGAGAAMGDDRHVSVCTGHGDRALHVCSESAQSITVIRLMPCDGNGHCSTGTAGSIATSRSVTE